MTDRILVATLLWSPNSASYDFSRAYDEGWVEKLYRGFARNLSKPFDFVCYTDRPRAFKEPIQQIDIGKEKPSYADCIRPYELNRPMILVGLDTIVCGPCDDIAEFCFYSERLGLPRDPFNKAIACNGVALVPGGNEFIAKEHKGQNDMDWVKSFPHLFLDDYFPGRIISYKGQVRTNQHDWRNASIIYFHGADKPHQLPEEELVRQHWR